MLAPKERYYMEGTYLHNGMGFKISKRGSSYEFITELNEFARMGTMGECLTWAREKGSFRVQSICDRFAMAAVELSTQF